MYTRRKWQYSQVFLFFIENESQFPDNRSMDLDICRKCNKSKAEKLKCRLEKQLKKKDRGDVKVNLTGCLGGCKGLTIKISNQKRISGVKMKDVKKIAKSIA